VTIRVDRRDIAQKIFKNLARFFAQIAMDLLGDRHASRASVGTLVAALIFISLLALLPFISFRND